jgi:hypothetical protein
MLMANRAIACGFLLFTRCVNEQDNPLERPASDFHSKGVGLTETLSSSRSSSTCELPSNTLAGHRWNSPLMSAYKTKRFGRHLILFCAMGRDTVGVRKMESSKSRTGVLQNAPKTSSTSAALWLNLQIALDPKLKEKGVGGDFPGVSSSIKPATFRGRTIRQILAYIVLNGQAESWIAAGPPECLGFTPYCGLWYKIEEESSDPSYKTVLQNIRNNL